MAKTLVVVRNESQTYEVHLELGDDPPKKFVGGQSLDGERLKRELAQHGCPEAVINKALQEVETRGSTKIVL